MMATKTCDRCKYYTLPDHSGANEGKCAMTLDSNDGTPHADRAYGWDAESYQSGVYVGPKYGRIHWIKKGKK